MRAGGGVPDAGSRVPAPVAVLSKPVVLATSPREPVAVLKAPAVLFASAKNPMAVL